MRNSWEQLFYRIPAVATSDKKRSKCFIDDVSWYSVENEENSTAESEFWHKYMYKMPHTSPYVRAITWKQGLLASELCFKKTKQTVDRTGNFVWKTHT